MSGFIIRKEAETINRILPLFLLFPLYHASFIMIFGLL